MYVIEALLGYDWHPRVYVGEVLVTSEIYIVDISENNTDVRWDGDIGRRVLEMAQ